MRKLFNALAPGGVCIFSMGGLDEATEKVDSAMGPRMYYSSLGIPAMLTLLCDCGMICRHLEYDQYPQPHLYLIAQRPKDSAHDQTAV